MFDDITRGYLSFARCNLPHCLWRILRLVNVDADADRCDCCRNLVCSIWYVGDGTRGTTRLQDFVLEPSVTSYFIKMGIEGAEREVIRASADFLKNHRVKLSCCVYHRQDDAEEIEKMLKNLGFSCSFSDGWMLPDFNGFHFPYFRHGVIRARNW